MKDNPYWALTVCLGHLVIPRATLGYHNRSGGGGATGIEGMQVRDVSKPPAVSAQDSSPPKPCCVLTFC